MKQHNNKRLCFHATEKEYWAKRDFARANRREQTPAEKLLWQKIRKRQVNGHRFRRQHIISRYIVDFVCLEQKLVIEVNGGYHFEGDQPARDEKRLFDLMDLGFVILGFTNEQVLNETPMVLQMIEAQLG